MDAAKIFEGIALLIDLAQRGEIDPWDVQVIEVIDRYLSELILAQEIESRPREADLSQSGQAFLLASMLVLFKANTLTELESPAEEQELLGDDLLLEVEGEAGNRLRLPLEKQLHRRPAALPPQKRQVTLKELIDQLKLIATQLQSQEKLTAKATRNRRLGTQSETNTAAGSPLELAHQENLTEVAGELEQFLGHYSQPLLAQEHDWLNLEQLVELWTHAKRAALAASSTQEGKPAFSHSDDGLPVQRHERVSVFWALLLLSAQSKVELSQEEFYQEIKIRAICEAQNLAIADSASKAAACSY